MKSGRDYRLFSVFWSISLPPAYKDLSFDKRILRMLRFYTSATSLNRSSNFFLFYSEIPWIMLFSY